MKHGFVTLLYSHTTPRYTAVKLLRYFISHDGRIVRSNTCVEVSRKLIYSVRNIHSSDDGSYWEVFGNHPKCWSEREREREREREKVNLKDTVQFTQYNMIPGTSYSPA